MNLNRNKLIGTGIVILGLLSIFFGRDIRNLGGLNNIETYDSVGARFASTTVATIPTAMFSLGGINTATSTATGATGNVYRKEGRIQNTSATDVFCIQAATSSGLTVTNFGFIIKASGTVNSVYSVNNPGSRYIGQVWCVASAANTVTVTEK